ncbi:MAG: class I SAM-dependent methyltransferase [Algicola sp.]|nr:class I SAM-dependent methyltransferase [Algicola sp.]
MKFKSLVLVSCLASCLGLTSLSSVASMTFDNGQRTAQDLKRDVTAKPQKIIEFAGIKKGMKVADIFGGGGYYSELLSQVVGENGKVYLHNNQAYLKFVGDELIARVKGHRLSNVVDYKREADNLEFADNSLDAVFFVLGYHDLYTSSDIWNIDPLKFIKQLKKALKPGGLLLVVDHSAVDGTDTKHSQKLHRIDENYVKNELTSNGFNFVKAGDMLRNAKDSRKISPFRPGIRRKTDRFVLLFTKQEQK